MHVYCGGKSRHRTRSSAHALWIRWSGACRCCPQGLSRTCRWWSIPDPVTTGWRSASGAVRFAGRSVAYRELDERSNRLARRLIRYGAGPETTVASALTRSVESIVTLWAIVKTGAIYVPIDPNYPAARIAHLLAGSETKLGVTVTDLCARLPQSVHWMVLDDDSVAPVIDAEPATAITQADRTVALRSDHAAYLIYTSRIHGNPEGCHDHPQGCPGGRPADHHRIPATRCYGPGARSVAATRPGRRRRRAVSGRCGSRPRLSPPSGPYLVPVRRRPLRRPR
ncbi:AMP-binding protein [Nocardia sp. NPDC024068]|uniref:AMP-binding protein n=1 Tax=Nocardia sp. NPDC024068 TaxID=3157197 RepID=UPI0033F78B42